MEEEPRYDSYASEEEAVLSRDGYPEEGVNPAVLKRVEEILNALTPEELQSFTDQGMSTEDIKAHLIGMASAEMQAPQP